MKVLLTSHGSTGDIYPFIALGAQLVQDGHTVSFATAPLFEPEITAAGLRFVYLPPDWGQSQFNEAMLKLTKARTTIETLQIIYRHTLPFVDDVVQILEREILDTDVVVSSYLFPHYRIIAEKFQKPFAIVTFCHNVIPSDGAPPPHPLSKIPFPKFLRKYWVRANWKVSNKVVDNAINRVIGKRLKKIGIPQVKDFLIQPADLSLVSVSKSLFEPEYPYSSKFKFAGYMRWQSETKPETLEYLEAIFEKGPIPVLTFGSVTFKNKNTVVDRFLKNWPSDKHIVVQKGWVGFTPPEPRENIHVIGSLKHDDLFPKASVVIHHGGAGTTSTALHAGVPQIIIPHIADQPFWANEVVRLQAGRKLNRRFWPEKISDLVEEVTSDEEMKARCKEIGDDLKTENGPSNASSLLSEFVENHRIQLELQARS
ncbi:MAG: glycosyltransferase [Opitutales bacterium]|nr:glycosyltransferase [Opitutales bacterium]